MQDHAAGKVHFTKSKPSMLLAYYEACVSKVDAYRRERYLKSGRGKRYVRQRLSGWLNDTWPVKLERH
jgi:putative endonuclease